MPRILVTGMSGAGKTTLLDELRRRGRHCVETDDGDWLTQEGLWDEPRIAQLLEKHADVVVVGTVENQGRFYDRFEHVVLLSAPVEVLLERAASRTNNPYGNSRQERADIARYVTTVEPLLRAGADVELDGRRPTAQLADAVEHLMAGG